MDGLGATLGRSSFGGARMQWQDLPARLDELREKLAAPAWDLKRAVADVFTRHDVGYFYCPATQKVAVHGPVDVGEFARCKAAAARAVGRDHVREAPLDDARAACGEWVKVAYS